ncbi:MAG: hypothetical protein HUJ68_09980 [Clostridia bacterium]|nr:hypothetical protein [Clostridia bacterium]
MYLDPQMIPEDMNILHSNNMEKYSIEKANGGYILPKDLKEKTIKFIKKNFDLNDVEAENYYKMIGGR